jgi:hypothetical protein
MDARYFSPNELDDFIGHRNIPDDIQLLQCLGICSIADIIEVCEKQRKGLTSTPHEILKDIFRQIVITGEINGLIYVANLEREDLLDALFEREGVLWSEVAQRHIHPLHSVRLLTLRVTDSKWWDEDVYRQMNDTFASIDSL